VEGKSGRGRGEGIESGGRVVVQKERIFSEPLVVGEVLDPARDDGREKRLPETVWEVETGDGKALDLGKGMF